MAAFDDLETGIRSLGFGGAFTAVSDDADGLYWNTAGLARQNRPNLTSGVFRPYGMKALQYQSLAVVYPVRVGVLGAAIKTFGRSRYYFEETAILAYSRPLGRTFTGGIALRYMGLHIEPAYGADWCVGVDGGIMWYPIKELAVGASVRNINVPTLSVEKEYVMPVGSIGVSYRPTAGVVVAADLYRDARHFLQIRMGQEVLLIKHLIFRCGFQTAPARFTVGAGIVAGWFGCDYALYSHPSLGFTHQAGIRLQWKK